AGDVGHEEAEVIRLGVVLGSPDLLQELALGDKPPAVADENLDEVPLGGCQADLVAVAPYLLRRQVDGEVGGLDEGILLGRCGAPKRGAQPGEGLGPAA